VAALFLRIAIEAVPRIGGMVINL